MRDELSGPARALSEMRERDEQAGVDPRTFTATPAPPPAPAPPGIREILAADPPDWEVERVERERLERERQRQQRAQIAAEELAKLEDQAALQPYPAKPRRWRK